MIFGYVLLITVPILLMLYTYSIRKTALNEGVKKAQINTYCLTVAAFSALFCALILRVVLTTEQPLIVLAIAILAWLVARIASRSWPVQPDEDHRLEK